MGKKRVFNDPSSNKKNGNPLNRKQARKILRKQKKINNALRFAKSKNTNKICISSNDVKYLKAFQNGANMENKNIISQLNNKVLANDGPINNNNTTKVNKKKKKKQKCPTKKDQEEEKNSDEVSFKLSDSTNSRLARLQEYVNRETKKMTDKPKKENEPKSNLRTDKLIKDKEQINEFLLGQKSDDREIAKLSKKLSLKSYHKPIHPIFEDDFGDIIKDIEEGTFDKSKYKNDIMNYDSDDNFERDVLVSLGKIEPQKSGKSNNNTKTLRGKEESSDISDNEEDEDNIKTLRGKEESSDISDNEEDEDNIKTLRGKEESFDISDNEEDEDNIKTLRGKEESSDISDNEEDEDNIKTLRGKEESSDISDNEEDEDNIKTLRGEEESSDISDNEEDEDNIKTLRGEEESSDISDNEEDEDNIKTLKGKEESSDISDNEEDEDNTDNFLDDEAEESDIEEDSDEEPEDNEEEIMFESGSSLRSEIPKSTGPSINTIFDLYAKNDSEDEDEEDTDLEGFVVDDDFVEYTDEDSPVKKISKRKKSRIINRERMNSGDSDIILIENVENKNKCKRRRIISDSDNEDVLANVSKEKRHDKKKCNDNQKEFSDNDVTVIDKVSAKNKCDKDILVIEDNTNVESKQVTTKSILKDNSINTDKFSKKSKNKINHKDGKPKKRVSFNLSENEESNLISEEKCEEYHEDIYGRLRDNKGNIIKEKNDGEVNGKYIPPAMRKLMELNNDAQKKEHLAQLKKKLKGQLNRLAESNMAGILSQVEVFYQNNSSNDMNDTMTKLLFEVLVTTVLTPERLVQDHALLVAVLSANVGSEVGAHILTEFVCKWIEDLESFRPTENAHEIDSKELDNMLMFICQLYNFRVMDSSLVYDILNKLLSRELNSKEVDLILLVLKSVGFTLRKDDPLALKSLITEINAKSSAGASVQNTETFTRIKFMLEILTAIRNNNMNKVANFDPSHSQHLKQLMKGFIRKGCRTSELKISLQDLLKSKIVGKWWIVGSAWGGGLKERNLPQEDHVDEKINSLNNNRSNNEYSDKFKKKAAKLQMSRPPRINILYSITEGAANYEEAFEKVVELHLPKNQEQEIFNVLVYCCLRCKTYSQLYNNLALKLIKFKKQYVRLLQFSIWDRFKELDSMKPQYAANLAKFIANLIAENGLNLSVFKFLDFAQASEETISFLRQALLGIFLHPTGTYAVSKAFELLCANPKLKSLRQYIRLFIVKFISSHTCEDQANNQMLKSRVKLAVQQLNSVGGIKL